MDFKKIIDSTRNYNFHSHTQFCDGHADMETMARAAVEAGMEYYGFSPHSPVPIASPCNMTAQSVEEYTACFEQIKQIPELASCRFFRGMEIDYLNEEWGPSHPYFASLGLDFSIGSVHFIPTKEGEPVDIDGRFENFKHRMQKYFRNDIEYVVGTFFEQSEKMIEAGGFDILGHFDKVGQNANYYRPGIEDSAYYQDLVGRVIDKIINNDIIIELNTKARREHGRFFPGERYLPRLQDAGVTIVVNSDAHYPQYITASRDEAFELLDRHANS